VIEPGLRHFRIELIDEPADQVGPIVNFSQELVAGQALC
jgi:hypothetical protein